MPTLDDRNARRAARATLHAAANPFRELAFQSAQDILMAEGVPGVSFTHIDVLARASYVSWTTNPARGRTWPWPSLVDETRGDDPTCLEAALWRDGVLCGLALGVGEGASSAAPGYVAIDFLERTPYADNPLRGRLLLAAIAVMLAYAVVLGRPEARITRPNRYLKASLARTGLPFALVDSPGQHPYLAFHG